MSAIENLIDRFDVIEDPRINGMTTYPLSEILLISLCAVICRCSDWEEIELWGEYNLDWLKGFSAFTNGIPKPATFARVFNALNSKALKLCLESWVNSLLLDLNGKQIAIDGKTIKGSKLSCDGRGAAHIVSAFVHEYGLVLTRGKG